MHWLLRAVFASRCFPTVLRNRSTKINPTIQPLKFSQIKVEMQFLANNSLSLYRVKSIVFAPSFPFVGLSSMFPLRQNVLNGNNSRRSAGEFLVWIALPCYRWETVKTDAQRHDWRSMAEQQSGIQNNVAQRLWLPDILKRKHTTRRCSRRSLLSLENSMDSIGKILKIASRTIRSIPCVC